MYINEDSFENAVLSVLALLISGGLFIFSLVIFDKPEKNNIEQKQKIQKRYKQRRI